MAVGGDSLALILAEIALSSLAIALTSLAMNLAPNPYAASPAPDRRLTWRSDVRRHARRDPRIRCDDVRVGTMRCLMSCRRPCVVRIRLPGRMGYVIGDLPPERSAVEALIGYLLAYGATDSGVVAYRDWPDGVKGRFVARIPARDMQPLGK